MNKKTNVTMREDQARKAGTKKERTKALHLKTLSLICSAENLAAQAQALYFEMRDEAMFPVVSKIE